MVSIVFGSYYANLCSVWFNYFLVALNHTTAQPLLWRLWLQKLHFSTVGEAQTRPPYLFMSIVAAFPQTNEEAGDLFKNAKLRGKC